MYRGLLLLYAVCFLVISSSGAKRDSIEEGESWGLTCFAPNFTQNIDFQLRRGDTFETVASCSKQNVCQTFNSNYRKPVLGYGKETDPETGQKSEMYWSRMVTKNVSRDENHFRCLADGYMRTQGYQLDTYVKPTKPTCNNPVLTSSGDMLSVTCKTDQVYPATQCVFSSNALPANFNVPVTYRKRQSPIKPSDFSTECEGRIPVSAFSVGRYQFQVTMYADVKDGKNKTSIESDRTSAFEISLPRVVIASDCPVGPGIKDGFIEKGTTATCKCELSYEGFPPGYAQWYTSDGVAIGTRHHDGSATLHLTYDASNPKPSYECRAKSLVRGTKQFTHFSPTFTEGKNDQITEDDDDNGDSLYLIVGLAALGIVLVVVVIVAVCLYRKKTRPTSNPSTSVTFNKTNDGQISIKRDNNDLPRNIPPSHHQPPPYEGRIEHQFSRIYDLPNTDDGYLVPVDNK